MGVHTTVRLEDVCTHHSAGGRCVYTPQCRWQMCVRTTVEAADVCTHHSAGGRCVYTPQCGWKMCVHTTVQVEDVCTKLIRSRGELFTFVDLYKKRMLLTGIPVVFHAVRRDNDFK
jgi:hypothetical protein